VVRVLIISDNAIFYGRLKNLLRSIFNVQVIEQELDVKQAERQVEALKPNVIIWDDGEVTGDEAREQALLLLEARPGVRVIVADLEHQELGFYQSARGVIDNTQDFLKLVKHDLVPT
jgi:chemotaxis response regulator CheB